MALKPRTLIRTVVLLAIVGAVAVNFVPDPGALLGGFGELDYDGAAKKQLFTIFESMKPNDPVVLKGRRKLSSLLFA